MVVSQVEASELIEVRIRKDRRSVVAMGGFASDKYRQIIQQLYRQAVSKINGPKDNSDRYSVGMTLRPVDAAVAE